MYNLVSSIKGGDQNMSSDEKLLNAIIEVANASRPTSVSPSKVHEVSELSDTNFVQSLKSLENSGFIVLKYGNNTLVDISVTTSVPTE